ncbi:serine hydrolase domain-containing protein [Moorena producens]|uniref:serine hydrolase domain-containing protein n=1 Tax=Moorena producens TaxID=1155739 RepID=UPI003C792BC3
MKWVQKLSLTVVTAVIINLDVSVLAQSLPVAKKPEQVGFCSDKLEAITDDLQNRVDKQEIAGGVVIIARKGKIAYREAVGLRDIEGSDSMKPDTIFRIASNSKIMTGFAISLLASDGLIDLKDPVSNYIPAFVNMKVLVPDSSGQANDYKTRGATNKITIEQLLNHTSGVDYNLNNHPILGPLLKEAQISDGYSTTPGTIGDMVGRLAKLPLLFEPGTQWNYGLNSDILGYLVEVVSRQTLAEFLQERVFEPLEMKDTSFYVPPSKRNRLAAVYIPNFENGGLIRMGTTPKEIVPGLIMDEAYPYKTGDTYFSGGAGLVSTPDDYVRFLQMLLNKGKLKSRDGRKIVRIAKPKTVKKFLSVRDNDKETNEVLTEFFNIAGYKFTNGFVVKDDPNASNKPSSVGSFQWAGVYNTHYFADPKRKLIGVVMTQLFPSLQTDLRHKYESLTYQALAPNCKALVSE